MVKIAILAENMYEDLELQYPLFRLKEEEFQIDILGTQKDTEYKSKHGYPAKSDYATDEVSADDYDAVIVPGGFSPDFMRRNPPTIEFVRKMDEQGKLIAAICHGGWILASACNLEGKKVTSFFSIKDDLINAGAEWVDMEVVEDGNIITSRFPDDLVPFTKAIINKLNREM